MTSNSLVPIVVTTREGLARVSPDSLLRQLGDWLRDVNEPGLAVTLPDGTSVVVSRVPPPAKSEPRPR